jgi:hypothetical protein
MNENMLPIVASHPDDPLRIADYRFNHPDAPIIIKQPVEHLDGSTELIDIEISN